jgi:putative peptide zinc metalloprotease protein
MRIADDTTFEIGNAQLKLRDGLQFTLQQSGNEDWYLIEDEIQGRFFRVGLAEYTVLSLLNGQRKLSEAIAIASSRLGKDALTSHDAAQLSRWVIQSELANTDASKSFTRVLQRNEKEASRLRLNYLNPIAVRIPLCNPDKLLTLAARWLGGLIHWPLLVIWLVVVGYGAIQMFQHWEEFVFGRVQTFAPTDLFWIAAAWLVLKILHEFSHGMLCKKFGGNVTQFGVLLLLLIPLPFVDVTTSWRFENKWKRILTAAAGMMSELFIAAIAAVIWVSIEPGPLRFHLGNLIVAATVHTMLFNANPLMKFDGYYMLADWLEIPNLYGRGSQHVSSVCRRLFLGLTGSTESSRMGTVIKIYGWATKVWLIVICFSLGFAAYSMFDGIGLVVTALAGVAWFGIPTFRMTRFLVFGTVTEQPNRLRFATVTTMLFGGIFLLFAFTPAPTAISLPVLVEYDPLTVVRSQASGLIEEIEVRSGDVVRQGQPVIRLRNVELWSDWQTTWLKFKEAELRLREYEASGAVSQWQKQQETLVALEKQLEELRQLNESLIVRAPVDGVVLTRDLDSQLGRFVDPGTELIKIGPSGRFKLIGLAGQDDAKWFQDSLNKPVEIRIWGSYFVDFQSSIAKVNPRATDTLPHGGFAVPFNGPLSVIHERATSGETTGDPNQSTAANLRLTQPRVEIELRVPADIQLQLHAGQMGLASFHDRRISLGQFLVDHSRRLISRNVNKNHGL